MGTGRYVFPKQRRLRVAADFHRVRQGGKRRHTPSFIVVILDRPNSLTRLGLTVSRKVGGAVQRNRVKRLVREFFRLHTDHLPAGVDISVIAKNGAAELSWAQVCGELHFLAET